MVQGCGSTVIGGFRYVNLEFACGCGGLSDDVLSRRDTMVRITGWRTLGFSIVSCPKPKPAAATGHGSVAKKDHTIRIFVLGESAAMGDPEPAFGMPEILRVLLESRYPQTA